MDRKTEELLNKHGLATEEAAVSWLLWQGCLNKDLDDDCIDCSHSRRCNDLALDPSDLREEVALSVDVPMHKAFLNFAVSKHNDDLR